MRSTFLASVVICLAPLPAMAISLSNIDNFQDGTQDLWTNGSAPDPLNITTGGPAGAGDHYLQITANGSSGSGGKLTSYNRNQWVGNYIAAGVTGISMDLKSFDISSSTTLHVRLALKSTTSIGAVPSYVTPDFALPTDGAWHHATFLLDSSLIPLNSPSILASFLTNPAELRIIDSASPSINGFPINSQLGVDNIKALPEPATASLLALGAAALLLWHWARRCRPA
jgi:hypothetical protein